DDHAVDGLAYSGHRIGIERAHQFAGLPDHGFWKRAGQMKLAADADEIDTGVTRLAETLDDDAARRPPFVRVLRQFDYDLVTHLRRLGPGVTDEHRAVQHFAVSLHKPGPVLMLEHADKLTVAAIDHFDDLPAKRRLSASMAAPENPAEHTVAGQGIHGLTFGDIQIAVGCDFVGHDKAKAAGIAA